MISALLIDKLPEGDKENHFIYQEDLEPSQFSGPIFLKNVSELIRFPNLGVDENGKVIKTDSRLFLQNIVSIGMHLAQVSKDVEELKKIGIEAQIIVEESCDKIAQRVIENHLEKKKPIFMRGKWVGDDIGSKEESITNTFSKGEFFGFRLENAKDLPDSSAKNVGRLLFNTVNEKIYCDVGYKLKRVSCEKIEKLFAINSGETKIALDISDSDIDDARLALWQVSRNDQDFLRINCKISTPSAKIVVIELEEGAQPGTYRLLGLE